MVLRAIATATFPQIVGIPGARGNSINVRLVGDRKEKFQIPTSKFQTNFKKPSLQAPRFDTHGGSTLEAWSLVRFWMLEFGIWSFLLRL
jgi:hypothetical protein